VKYLMDPAKEYYDQDLGNYLILIVWKSNSYTTYSFSPNNVCVYIYQFTPIEDNIIRKKLLDELIEIYDKDYKKIDNYWIEEYNGINIKHIVQEKILEDKIGITIIMEKQ